MQDDRAAESKRALADGRAALNAGRYADAEEAFGRADGPAALTGLAEVAFQRGNYPEAVKLARRAVDAGGAVPARMVLGNSYFKLKKYDDAIAEYQAVLKIDRGHVEAARLLDACEKKRGSGG